MIVLLTPLLALSARAAEPPEGRWVWGDPHAHSGWSYDGCEDEAALCAPRGEEPATDFFVEAEASGLDFAALSDHAEADAWAPDGADGERWEVWEEQAAAVRATQGGAVLPLLGYEWTAFRSPTRTGASRGSHRTVLLGDDDPCVARRVSGFLFDEGEVIAPDGLAVYLQTDGEYAEEVGELWDALDAAEESCGPTRWISFAHHSAYSNPQETDWSVSENRPDREFLVEMASEHGSSECVDPDAEGCDWRRNDVQGYTPDGSVQAALDRGFVLGFVGGTDSHDARPGSLDDGPGPVGHLDDGVPRVQFASGAITGAWLADGESLTTDTLFDALEARRTLVSTGPRPDLRVWAEGEDGHIWLPGEEIPRRALPVTLHLEAGDPGEGYALASVERVGPGGLVEESATDGELALDWDGGPGDWTYLRLRYDAEDAGDGEERVWVSPWFVQGRCGCASGLAGGGGAGMWASLAGVLALGLRRGRAL